MPSAAQTERGWLRPALALVGCVTLARLIALAFDRTDLFVDETQYWLWGQNLDFGYYSKPPLIGWLIRAVTDLAGSSAPFWVRMPGAVLHGATALILAALAARVAGRSAAIWTAALYVTLPFVALGSVMISTDTVMAPFFAGALLFFWRAGEGHLARDAALAGACAGAAFMAKYAAVYVLIGAALAAAAVPERRIGWRNTLILLIAFVAVISPNLIWNVEHQFLTVRHTVDDNVGFGQGAGGLHWHELASFVAAQFGVFGPVAMTALLIGFTRRAAGARALGLLAAPPLVAVCAEALLNRAYANWAIAAFFAGTVLAVIVLPRWGRWAALGLNLVVAVAIPALTVLAPWPEVNGKPALNRYLGRAELSRRILALAIAEGAPVYSDDRDILADLFYAGRDSGVTIYAPRPAGRPGNYYEQTFPLPEGYTGRLLAIRRTPVHCGGVPVPPAAILNGSGTWSGKNVTPYLIAGDCLAAAPD